MKIGFIFVLFNTPKSEVERLKKEVSRLGIIDYKLYFIDNSRLNRGYAAAANLGIKKGLKDNVELFAVANPDISLEKITEKNIFEAKKHFDLFGFSMMQDETIFYGGTLDKLRMSGGLVEKKPSRVYSPTDFVSGSLIFIKREVVEKVGLFDESYFLYYEDVDYCFRAKKKGFKAGIDTKNIYRHSEISKNNPLKERFLFRNHLKFLWKYGGLKQKAYEFFRLPKTIFEEVMKRSFYINFFSLNLSSVLNKILHFFLFILMIRVFPPAVYAIYTLAWTHTGLLQPLLDFGTTSYGLVYLPRLKSADSSKLFSFRIFLSVITFALTILLAFIFHYKISILVPVILTSFVILASGTSGSFLIFSSVAEKSYLASIVSAVFQVALVLMLIASVLIKPSMINLFYIIFFCYIAYGIFNYFFVKKLVKNIKFQIDLSSWIKIAKRSVVFLFIGLLASFYSQADFFILNFLKGPKAVGIYSAGYRFLDALMFMITAYNVSSMPVFSRLVKQGKGNFQRKIRNDVILVTIIGAFIACGFFFLGPFVLPYFIKGDYVPAIRVMQIIIFSLPLILLTSVSLNSLYALGQAKKVVYLFSFQLVYNLTANFVFIPRYGFIASSWITLVGEVINTSVSFIILKKAIDENFR